MRVHARLHAKAAGKILLYIPSIDVATGRMNKADFDEIPAMLNIATSAKFLGTLVVFVGIEVILSESFLPPRILRGTLVTVVGIELRPLELPV